MYMAIWGMEMVFRDCLLWAMLRIGQLAVECNGMTEQFILMLIQSRVVSLAYVAGFPSISRESRILPYWTDPDLLG